MKYGTCATCKYCVGFTDSDDEQHAICVCCESEWYFCNGTFEEVETLECSCDQYDRHDFYRTF